MKNKNLIGILGLLLVLLTSCLTTRQTNLLQPAKGNIPTYLLVTETENYRIQIGDELNISIRFSSKNTATQQLYSLFSSGNSTATGGNGFQSFSVSNEGDIRFPYLGDVAVVGKTVLEVEAELGSRINKEIVKQECFVYVRLSNRYFSVIGESSSQRYPMATEQLTIFQALSQSGDIRPYGNRAQVKIIRNTPQGTQIKTFDLRSEEIIHSEFYYIQPNDVIYIQPLGRQFWGVDSFQSIFGLITTLSSLGVMLYYFIKK